MTLTAQDKKYLLYAAIGLGALFAIQAVNSAAESAGEEVGFALPVIGLGAAALLLL